MTVYICPGEKAFNRQILLISRYYKKNPILSFKGEGWHDVSNKDLLKWFSEGSKIIYLPSPVNKNLVDRVEALSK